MFAVPGWEQSRDTDLETTLDYVRRNSRSVTGADFDMTLGAKSKNTGLRLLFRTLGEDPAAMNHVAVHLTRWPGG